MIEQTPSLLLSSSSSSSQGGGSDDLLSSNGVCVIVRCRPLNHGREEDGSSRLHVNSMNNTVEVKMSSSPNSNTKRVFQFHCVADETKSQQFIFNEAGRPIVKCALAGFNGAILTYGQTGSGKTFTMQGSQNLGAPPSTNPSGGFRYKENDRSKHSCDGDEDKRENYRKKEDSEKNECDADESKGLIQMVCEEIFANTTNENGGKESSKEKGTVSYKYKIQASYLEIYNETLIDLLAASPASPSTPSMASSSWINPNTNNANSYGLSSRLYNRSSSSISAKVQNSGQKRLTIREDTTGTINVVGLSQHDVNSPEDCYNLLRSGAEKRKVATTRMNMGSSRSHAIFTLFLSRTDIGSGIVRVSRLHLVDLAGSERQRATGTSGIRLREAGGINKSLSALGNVINSISSSPSTNSIAIASPRMKSKLKTPRKSPFSPSPSQSGTVSTPVTPSSSSNRLIFPSCRESKLTFLLKDALGGNSKLCVIAAISPALSSLDETISTLEFAQRCSAVKNSAVVNEILSTDVQQLQNEVKRLQQALKSTHRSLSHSTAGTEELRKKVEALTKYKHKDPGQECDMCIFKQQQFDEEKRKLLSDLNRMTAKCKGMIETNQLLWNSLIHQQNNGVDIDMSVDIDMNVDVNVDRTTHPTTSFDGGQGIADRPLVKSGDDEDGDDESPRSCLISTVEST